MVAVYDWLGSLDLHPEHFSLQVHPATTVSPEEGIFGYEGVVMYIRALDEPLLMGTNSPEISFLGFGNCTSHDEIATHDKDCESLSLLAIDPVTETLPQQLMELDEERSPLQQQPASQPEGKLLYSPSREFRPIRQTARRNTAGSLLNSPLEETAPVGIFSPGGDLKGSDKGGSGGSNATALNGSESSPVTNSAPSVSKPDSNVKVPAKRGRQKAVTTTKQRLAKILKLDKSGRYMR